MYLTCSHAQSTPEYHVWPQVEWAEQDRLTMGNPLTVSCLIASRPLGPSTQNLVHSMVFSYYNISVARSL